MKLNFNKMQGLGNDFVIIDVINTNSFHLSVEQLQFLANRRFGIGCDQILVIGKSCIPSVDFDYRIFNADGSVAGNCGNGARCVVKYLYARYKIDKSNIVLSIQNQNLIGYKSSDGNISVSMGVPDFRPSAIPFVHEYNLDNRYQVNLENEIINFGVVSVGNPHAVIKLLDENSFTDTRHLALIGQLLQNSKLFPSGVNVNFYVVVDSSTLSLKTYERGCGFTPACGTGAVATSSYAILNNQIDNKVNVLMDGGSLAIEWDMQNEIKMTGPAIIVFTGSIDL